MKCFKLAKALIVDELYPDEDSPSNFDKNDVFGLADLNTAFAELNQTTKAGQDLLKEALPILSSGTLSDQMLEELIKEGPPSGIITAAMPPGQFVTLSGAGSMLSYVGPTLYHTLVALEKVCPDNFQFEHHKAVEKKGYHVNIAFFVPHKSGLFDDLKMFEGFLV